MKANHKYSILQGDERYCWVTGARNVPLEKHHILYGPKFRSIADKNGFFVYLTPEMHRGTQGVHGRDGHVLDQMLKKAVQEAYEERHGHDAWMKVVGRNYL